MVYPSTPAVHGFRLAPDKNEKQEKNKLFYKTLFLLGFFIGYLGQIVCVHD